MCKIVKVLGHIKCPTLSLGSCLRLASLPRRLLALMPDSEVCMINCVARNCWICSRTSLCISTAMWNTSWSELLYITAFWNISMMSRWNSAVVRISPVSMFFLMVDRSIGLRTRNCHKDFVGTSTLSQNIKHNWISYYKPFKFTFTTIRSHLCTILW